MIAAEVSHYNRSEIVSMGYQKARSTNGDHQVLPNAFDSVYSSFIADIDALEDKKNRLLNRIEEQRAKSIQNLEAKQELDINAIIVKYDTKNQILTTQIANSKSQIDLNKAQIERLESHDVQRIEVQVASIKENINIQEREFIRPALKWFELLPAIVINLGLFFYLVLFYSSAAYILMFSKLDAKEAKMSGVSILPPEVFNPNALSMAVDKGGTAIPFILLFVFVPMTLSIIGKILGTKHLLNTSLLFTGVVVVDALIAYVVSESIHEVEYLSGNVNEVWQLSMVLSNPNFYLVFVMGALGLFLFKFAFDKLMGIFEDRNPQIAELRSKKIIEQLGAKISELEERKAQISIEIHEFKQANIICDRDVTRDNYALNHLPETRESEIARTKSETNISIEGITRITDVYISHIENDNYLISFHAIRDRISTFLDGWFQYLHEEYSIARATNITRLSRDAAILWQEDKLVSKSLDTRINR